MIAYKLRSGRTIDLSDPRPESVCLDSVAHALASTRRFTGHHPGRVSVAEHSIAVANRIDTRPGRMRLLALLHDAHEAYVGDMSRPVQRLRVIRWDYGACYELHLSADEVWRYWSERWQRAIWDALGVERPTEHEQGAIDAADSATCEAELAEWRRWASPRTEPSARWLAEVRACRSGEP